MHYRHGACEGTIPADVGRCCLAGGWGAAGVQLLRLLLPFTRSLMPLVIGSSKASAAA